MASTSGVNASVVIVEDRSDAAPAVNDEVV